jgi:hypothetical protein
VGSRADDTVVEVGTHGIVKEEGARDNDAVGEDVGDIAGEVDPDTAEKGAGGTAREEALDTGDLDTVVSCAAVADKSIARRQEKIADVVVGEPVVVVVVVVEVAGAEGQDGR